MPAGPIRVEGLRELQRAFRRADPVLRKELRAGLRLAAEPVKTSAEQLALSEISHMTIPWSKMRVGVTQREVYVAPRQRGIKARGDDPRRRRNLFDLLLGKSLEPALAQHLGDVELELEHVIDSVGRAWERA
jgi:hypothetical protein